MKKQLLFFSFSMLSLISQARWKDGGTKITTTQNVGIGTENPGYKLDVEGDLRSRRVIISSGALTLKDDNVFSYDSKKMFHYGLQWGSDSWDKEGHTLWQSGYAGMKMFTGGSSRLSISRLGNVGIGTDNPAYKLDIEGDLRSRRMILSSGVLTLKETDVFSYDNKNVPHYGLQWGSDSWDKEGHTLWQSGYAGMKMFTGGQSRFVIHRLGNVGIGTDNPTQKLDIVGNVKANGAFINGIVYANEIKVESTKWADFVFDKEYKLRSLEEVKSHIEEYKHLPDIPSEAEVKENGVSLGEMQAKLLQKIEELTLYVIELKEENQQIKKENQEIKQKLQNL